MQNDEKIQLTSEGFAKMYITTKEVSREKECLCSKI